MIKIEGNFSKYFKLPEFYSKIRKKKTLQINIAEKIIIANSACI